MRLFGLEIRRPDREPEERVEAQYTQSSPRLVEVLGWGEATAGENVTIKSALGVPAIWAAVNFLAGTMASLPVHTYRRDGDGRARLRTGVGSLLTGAVNPELTSFQWRKYLFDQVFTSGRGLTYIERNKAGRVANLWPLEPEKVTVKMSAGRKKYHYARGDGTEVVYAADEIIDLTFMLGSDMLTAVSPLMSNKETVGLAQAATKYGGKFFENGGVPPFAIEGPFESPAGMQRAGADLEEAVKKAAKEKRQALVLPAGHTIKSLGVDPDKAQMVELQQFLIEQIARIFSLPPTFLQDLSKGTYSNTEQQDLHFVKHTLRRWVTQFEQELNLKLLGRTSQLFIEVNLDGLLRGDFKTRMDGYASGIQNGVLKPNEARQRENLAPDPVGNDLMIQGATVPIGKQPKAQE
ncbi:phage portal protein [Maritimibacter sp. DP07]|uniref:Phage portal protein n=1 Tax=Maritimibacter harenae TaxID=2606218 RepID=A0A845MAG0_9RHOB|nr:phage portal protein [Maritimibacter harenae]MZR14234.1 phage portal protein [Maritimibacter harenae]